MHRDRVNSSLSPISDRDVRAALDAVRARIARSCPKGTEAENVAIVAVTKGFGPDAPRAAITAGLRDLGENYYQEAAAKYAQVMRPAGVLLHFIGRVQRNKARRIAELFDVVQTVDDVSVARALDEAATAAHKTLTVLVQVNVALDQRQGVMPVDFRAFVKTLDGMPGLAVRGLMAMGPRRLSEAPEAFARARACFDELQQAHPQVDTLSMGMSDDLESAVAAGSTMVRVGTALFGARPAQK
jgi:pyridoxal phosphate enzyme (YggS family)